VTYRTHVALSLSLTLIPFSTTILPVEDTLQLALIIITTYIFSLSPDFDEPNSYLSKRFPWIIISSVISIFTTHRGVTHRFLAPFIVTIATLPFFVYYPEYSFLIPVIFLAYLGHLIGDGFTIGGLRRFYYPFSKSTKWFLPKILRFKTGSITENFYLFIFSILSIFQLYFVIINNSIAGITQYFS